MRLVNMLLFLVTSSILVACGPSEAERQEQLTATADATFAAPTVEVPASPTTPDCLVPTAGTLLLKDEEGGYCLLYPEGHGVVIPFAGEVCVVPGEAPYTACHSASLFINVEGAEGRTPEQLADVASVEMPCGEERYNLSIAHEKAVVLTECAGQDTSRKVLMVHDDRLYTLTFLDLSERFYAQVITSFVFLR